MNASKADELDNIHFLVAAQGVFTTTEPDAPAHDAYTRLTTLDKPYARKMALVTRH